MSITRRELIGTAAAAAMAAAAEKLQAQGETPIRAGLIGCGGRGTGAALNVLEAYPNVEIVALADMWPERLDRARQALVKSKDPRVKLEDARCFTGFDAYKRLLDTNIDYAMMAEPPGLRPLHFEAAVEAGKHCWLEKPGCVDPAGARRLIAAGEKAREKNLGVHSSTENRHSAKMVETVKRIHEGQIGKVLAGRCFFNTGGLWKVERKPGMSDMEWQIRNWYYFDWLSGDHIVEQHVHELDVCHWVLKSPPVRAVAVGGRSQRVEPVYGNIWDHFAVDYEYPDNVHIMSMCRQWQNTDGHVGAYFVGTKGEASAYGGTITGENPWKWEGKMLSPHVQEHADFIAAIRSGKPYNEAKQLAYSTLIAILGRTAAYTGKVMTWDQVLNSDQNLLPEKFELGDLPARPVPVPGKKA
jgi:predicted dehydrogenase